LFLAISVTTIFEILIHFGCQYHVTKEVSLARDQAPQILVNSMVIRVILWVLSMIAMLGFVRFAGYPSTTSTLILILGAAKLWEGVAGVARACFQGFERMGPPAVSVVFERVFLMCAGVTALLMGGSAMTIALVMAASTALRTATVMISLRTVLDHLPRINWINVKSLVRQGMPYFLWSAFAVIYYRVDAVMLSLMTPEAVVGWYGAAYRIFDILMFLPSIYTTALLPVISRLLHKESHDVTSTIKQGVDFMLIAGIPIAVLIFTFAGHIIPFLFGAEEYGPSIILVRLFCIGLVLVYVDFVLGTAIVAANKQHPWSLVALAAIPLNVGLNYWLIPLFQQSHANGGIGAAIATTGTELFIMVSALALLPKPFLRFPWVGTATQSGVAAVAMVTLAWVLQDGPLHWIPRACLTACAYILTWASLTMWRHRESPSTIAVAFLHRWVAPLRRGDT
jgi:O-antigen/teichoic acid export membrane protein